MDNRIPGTTYTPKPEIDDAPVSPLGRIMLFACTASDYLGQEIAERLGIRLGKYERAIFPNENIFIKLNESVRGQDVYVVQTMCPPVHDNIWELLVMVDTLKRDSAARIN
ncbi:MAG: ribose-phosphate pyrophosphokinase-like domain-containing protein, partial [Phycisphaerales bacterium]|nr:ribose-phosphate pyrophosphokinase-like domain-containing protein [Phycisphaerales bacterium]